MRTVINIQSFIEITLDRLSHQYHCFILKRKIVEVIKIYLTHLPLSDDMNLHLYRELDIPTDVLEKIIYLIHNECKLLLNEAQVNTNDYIECSHIVNEYNEVSIIIENDGPYTQHEVGNLEPRAFIQYVNSMCLEDILERI